MTQDFAKKPRNTHKKKAPPKSSVPGWVWLFTGTVLGAFIMFLAYLSGLTPSQGTPATVASSAPKAQLKNENNIPKPRFDFYKLLQESEVIVPDREPSADRRSTPEDTMEYVLQVGSFKNSADADRLRAELILLNLDTHTEQVTVRNGETWHRVLVGPFANRSRLAKARSTLVSNNIDTLLLKRKAKG